MMLIATDSENGVILAERFRNITSESRLNGEKTCQGSGLRQRRKTVWQYGMQLEYLRISMIPSKKLTVENDGELSKKACRGERI
jgi:hypothetical protein